MDNVDNTLITFKAMRVPIIGGLCLGVLSSVMLKIGYLFGTHEDAIEKWLGIGKYKISLTLILITGCTYILLKCLESVLDKKIGITGITISAYRFSFGGSIGFMVSFLPLAFYDYLIMAKVIYMYYLLLGLCMFTFDMISHNTGSYKLKLTCFIASIMTLYVAVKNQDEFTVVPLEYVFATIIYIVTLGVIFFALRNTIRDYLSKTLL